MRHGLLPAARVTGDPPPARPAATPGERAAALTLLLADTSDPAALPADVADLSALADAGGIDLAGLLIVPGPGGTGVSAATLATPGPGGACDLFPPRLAPAAPPGAAGALLTAAEAFAAAAGCGTVQAFADPVRADDAAALTAAGFRRICELRTLRRCCSRPVLESPGDMARHMSLTRGSVGRFRETNRASYGDSRDAPEARGADADADFAAHADGSGFRPDLCRLAVVDGADAGLILVAADGDGPGAAWHVCYLGVRPGCRGRGVARSLLAGRLAAARDAGAAAVTCAVDAANGPARRLYAAAGFAETGRRVLFLKRLRPATGGGPGNRSAAPP